jgi:hypothetical protein
MKIHALLATTSLLAITSLAHATGNGLNTDPLGAGWNRGDANSGYMQWDSFPTFVISDDAPDASFGVGTPLLDQSSASGNPMFGAGLYTVLQGTPTPSNGDVIFQGNSTLLFTLTGSTTFAIQKLTLQMKRPGNVGGLAANFLPTISIDGGAPIAFNGTPSTITGSGDGSSDSGNYSVTTWTWDASIASNTTAGTLTINIPSNGNITRGIDFIAADFGGVTPVPEPSTYAMALALVAFVGFRVYKSRQNRKAACA